MGCLFRQCAKESAQLFLALNEAVKKQPRSSNGKPSLLVIVSSFSQPSSLQIQVVSDFALTADGWAVLQRLLGFTARMLQVNIVFSTVAAMWVVLRLPWPCSMLCSCLRGRFFSEWLSKLALDCQNYVVQSADHMVGNFPGVQVLPGCVRPVLSSFTLQTFMCNALHL